MSNLKYEDVIKLIKERKFRVIGIRSLCSDEKYNIGDICRCSYDWNHVHDRSTYEYENVMLNGTCAINTEIDYYWDEDEEMVEKIEATYEKAYWKEEVVLIAGYQWEYGEDDNEVIIEDAEVIFKFSGNKASWGLPGTGLAVTRSNNAATTVVCAPCPARQGVTGVRVPGGRGGTRAHTWEPALSTGRFDSPGSQN